MAFTLAYSKLDTTDDMYIFNFRSNEAKKNNSFFSTFHRCRLNSDFLFLYRPISILLFDIVDLNIFSFIENFLRKFLQIRTDAFRCTWKAFIETKLFFSFASTELE